MVTRKLIIYNDIGRKYGNVAVKDFWKYDKLEYKKNKLKLDIDFLNNRKPLGVYPKFLIFKLSNVSTKDSSSIRKGLLLSAIKKRNKELQHLLNNSVYLKTFFIYTAFNYWLIHPNKKLLQKLIYTQQKSYLHWREIVTYVCSQLAKLLLISHNMNYPRTNLIYINQIYTFESNQIKFEHLEPSLLVNRFIVHFLTILNPRKPKVR